MRPAGFGRYRHELGRADDIDSAILAVVEAEDLLRGDEPVLDDPVKRPADQLGRAFRPQARRDRTSLPSARLAMRVCSIGRSRQANATFVRWSFGTTPRCRIRR